MSNEEFIESVRLEGEIWKDVVGYEGLYMVSSLGRILSLERRIYNGKSIWTRAPFLMVLRPFKSKKCEYFSIILNSGNAPKRYPVHRIVAIAFIPNPDNYPEVDHINRNGRDNRVENLRWCTRKMNMANEETRKILAVCHDGHDGSYLWKPVVQLKNGSLVNIYKSITEATKNGFAHHNIVHVCRGDKHTHGGFNWMYLEDYEKMKKEQQ